MAKWKIILGALFFFCASGGIIYYMVTAVKLPFESVCDDTRNSRYTPLCENVGKRAYSLPELSAINEKNYGPILGVSWRAVGTTISSPGQKRRTSDRNAYYYIIGSDNGDYVYLRLTDQVDPR